MSPEEKIEKAIADLQAQAAADRKANLAALKRIEDERQLEREEAAQKAEDEANEKTSRGILGGMIEGISGLF